MKLVRIEKVEPLKEHRVRVAFTDGSTREIDLAPFLRGRVFDEIRRNPKVFASMHVDERSGTIAWDNGADIDPDVLYHNLKPAWADESEMELAE